MKLVIKTINISKEDIRKFAHILSSHYKCSVEGKDIVFQIKFGTSDDIKMLFNPILKQSLKRLNSASSRLYTYNNFDIIIQ